MLIWEKMNQKLDFLTLSYFKKFELAEETNYISK
jgi:hypothetical protein